MNNEIGFSFKFEEDEKKRLDVFLSEKLDGFTMSHIQKITFMLMVDL